MPLLMLHDAECNRATFWGTAVELDTDVILGFNTLDLIIVVLLIIFVLHGFSRGVGRTLGGAIGLVLGMLLALWLLPYVEIHTIERWIRLMAVAIVLLICMLGGQAIGELVLGRAVGTPPRKSKTLTGIDRAGGGLTGAAIATIVVLSLGGLLNQVPIPWLNSQLESSRSLQGMHRITPPQVTHALVKAQEEISGAPAMRELDQLLFPSVEPPRTEIKDQEVLDASASTVHILGSAPQCGYNQSGSGFVAPGGRVVTNAHVVRGTDSVSLFSPDGKEYKADVVQFVPEHDLAVLNAPSLELSPLTIATNTTNLQGPDTEAAFIGYPLSGPLSIGPATVQGSAYTSLGSDKGDPVQVTQFAGDVKQGNSGGPLVNMDGQVIGVVFGKAVNESAGYAIDTGTLNDVLAEAKNATTPVDTGTCQKS